LHCHPDPIAAITIGCREVPMGRFLASCFGIIVLATMVHGADDAVSKVAKLDEAWLDAYKAADFDS
jgi:hypothetical protein